MNIPTYGSLLRNKEAVVNEWAKDSAPDSFLNQIRKLVFAELSDISLPDGVSYCIQNWEWLIGKIGDPRRDLTLSILPHNLFKWWSVKMGVVDIFLLHEPLIVLEEWKRVYVRTPMVMTNWWWVITAINGNSVSLNLESWSDHKCIVWVEDLYTKKPE